MNMPDAQFPPLSPPPAPKGNWFARHKVITGIGAFVAVVAIASSAAGGGGSDTTTATAEQKTTASAPKSGGTKAVVEAPEEKVAANNGPSDSFPMQDGDWRLDSLNVSEEEFGESFTGRARITYTGDDSDGGNNSFTITIFSGGKDVGTLQGSLLDVMPGQTKTVDLFSMDEFAKGKLTYTFQNDW